MRKHQGCCGASASSLCASSAGVSSGAAVWAAIELAKRPENKGKTAFFGSINNAKFKQMVLPGDRLKLECEIIKRKGPIGVGKAVATNAEGKIAVSAELTFAIQ